MYEKIYKKLQKRVSDFTFENFYVIALKGKHVQGIKRVSKGNRSVSVNPFDIKDYLSGKGSDRYIIAHNHVSGNIEPSQEDIWSTKMVEKSIDIPCMGSMVFNPKCFLMFQVHNGHVQYFT